ncbi:hypothetical protein ACJX0J_023449, partial [Zea mays]
TDDIPQILFNYIFYVYFEASMADVRTQNALKGLEEVASFLRVLGCYSDRHLMEDVLSLLPHVKKDNQDKVESKQSKGNMPNKLLELRSCSNYLSS